MRRAIILAGIGIAMILAIIAFMQYSLRMEKSASPEDYVTFGRGDLTVTLFYNRPSKEDREIFGGLVPYGEVWRTGANEATTFETNRDLIVDGKTLRRGKYSLWTIPRPDTWTVIFNSEHGQWGINSKGEPNRDPARDVLTIDVPAMTQDRTIEQFTVTFESVGDDVEMVLMWDKTLVAVPFSYRR